MNRLDSWKAIADYLKRDVRTVMRWAKDDGMPVHRVMGLKGRSVFAFTGELDRWMSRGLGGLGASAGHRPQWIRPLLFVALAVLSVTVVAFIAKPRMSATSKPLASATLQPTGVTALDEDGRALWQYAFPPPYQGLSLGQNRWKAELADIDGDGQPEVVVPTALWQPPNSVGRELSGRFQVLSGTTGAERWQFSFDDQLRFGRQSYGAPWVISSWNRESGGQRRFVVAAHHFEWWPAVLTVLDNRGVREGTFVNAGWIFVMEWLPGGRLAAGGISNSRAGGMLAMLDAGAFPGQSPEAADSEFYCASCGDGRPVRYLVFPPSELNHSLASRKNEVFQITSRDGRLIVHTNEVPKTDVLAEGQATAGDVDAIFELTADGTPISAAYSDSYWSLHRRLEAAGRVTHTRDTCPDRAGPRFVDIWEPARGWWRADLLKNSAPTLRKESTR